MKAPRAILDTYSNIYLVVLQDARWTVISASTFDNRLLLLVFIGVLAISVIVIFSCC